MRYADIKYPDVANGPGVRVSLFVQGCSRHCKGCFNKETWDFNGGKQFTSDELSKIRKNMSYNWVQGISILGGEPLEQSEDLLNFLKYIKSKFPQKDIWMWTGYTYEDVKDNEIFKYVDVVVDGPFQEEKKNVSLQFRGSENQRIIQINNKE